MSDDTRGPRERAYDEHIAPLMTEIIGPVKKHKIPMLATFELDYEPEHGGPLHCTTCLTDGALDNRIDRARACIQPPAPVCLAVTASADKMTIEMV